jgi:molybdate transport system permease protein
MKDSPFWASGVLGPSLSLMSGQSALKLTKRPALDKSELLFRLVICLMGGLMIALIVLPVLALLLRAFTFSGSENVLEPGTLLNALLLSLGTTAVSMVGIVLLGTPLALMLARFQFPFKRILSVFVELPIVMPPVVAGLALLMAFGRRGLFGMVLESVGISITFTPLAVILAQMFVAAPFYIRAVQFRLNALPVDLEEAAQIDGARSWSLLRYIILPLTLPALLSGLMLSWARALGEFGATILFAGNLAGRTQTMPLLVYSALERDLDATFTVALFLLALAVLALGFVRWLGKLDESKGDDLRYL